MIEINRNDEESTVLISGREAEILEESDFDDFLLAECEFDDLREEFTQSLPRGVHVQVESEDGFGTHFFHRLILSCAADKMSLAFECEMPNKYWEGHYGLSAFLSEIRAQVDFHENWRVAEIFVEDVLKGITLERQLAFGMRLYPSIIEAAAELKIIVHAVEVALSGLPWRPEFATNEDAFCQKLLYPLLRRMGFVFVRYTHGKREYGKDLTFSELTPFGHYRHYGLQAKAGDVRGGVNSAVDELLGQIHDSFEMPYFELASKERRFISTFVIAISGRFTENAREKIVEKMPNGYAGSVYFLDRESITELVDRYWKSNKLRAP